MSIETTRDALDVFLLQLKGLGETVIMRIKEILNVQPFR